MRRATGSRASVAPRVGCVGRAGSSSPDRRGLAAVCHERGDAGRSISLPEIARRLLRVTRRRGAVTRGGRRCANATKRESCEAHAGGARYAPPVTARGGTVDVAAETGRTGTTRAWRSVRQRSGPRRARRTGTPRGPGVASRSGTSACGCSARSSPRSVTSWMRTRRHRRQDGGDRRPGDQRGRPGGHPRGAPEARGPDDPRRHRLRPDRAVPQGRDHHRGHGQRPEPDLHRTGRQARARRHELPQRRARAAGHRPDHHPDRPSHRRDEPAGRCPPPRRVPRQRDHRPLSLVGPVITVRKFSHTRTR